jgi:hypothetical protein
MFKLCVVKCTCYVSENWWRFHHFLCAHEWISSKNDNHCVVLVCVFVTYLSMEFSTGAMNGRHSFSPFLIIAVVKVLSSGGLVSLVFLE